MEAKDTVIKITEANIREYCGIDRYEVGDIANPIVVKGEVWDIPNLLKDQAEISFKAGIREVVEWIKTHPGKDKHTWEEWQAKLKE